MRIDKDIPIPPVNNGEGGYTNTLLQMGKGDSVFDTETDTNRVGNRWRTAANRHGIRIVIRKIGATGHRIWYAGKREEMNDV
jgi:hypothetical protein